MTSTRTAVLLILMCILAVPARATEQAKEHLIVDGRVLRIPVTPLRPVLDRLGKRPWVSETLSTGLWRGYVGTWLLKEDALYLVSMLREGFEAVEEGGAPRRVAKAIPLSLLFGEQPEPIHATWWSGQLMLPKGRLLRYARRERDRVHEKTLYLNFEKGRVVSRRLVDNSKEGRGLSPEDLQWVTGARQPPADDGLWRDARLLRTKAFQQAVPAGTSFRTRGVLTFSDPEPEEAKLWVPETPATPLMLFKVRDVAKAHAKSGYYHAELSGSWQKEGEETVLRVISVRALAPGETLHHPMFIVPALPESKMPDAAPMRTRGRGTVLRDAAGLKVMFGRWVTLNGRLDAGGLVPGTIATIHGVEVGQEETLRGTRALATGLLEKWIVTERQLKADRALARLFGARGPGTWYRLVRPVTGKLAPPRPVN